MTLAMTKRELWAESVKFCVTGVIAFAASVLYTDYKLDPRRNISVIPLSIEKIDSCDVDTAKLTAALKLLPPTEIPTGPSYTYEHYLHSLANSDHLGDRWIVRPNFVPAELLPQLKADGILRCARSSADAQDDLRFNTILVLQAALVVGQPTAYMMRRSCYLIYGGKEIPLSASVDAIQLRGVGVPVTAEPTALTFRETNSLVLQYDARQAERTDQTIFSSLVKSKDLEISVRCSVIGPGKDEEIGGGGRMAW